MRRCGGNDPFGGCFGGISQARMDLFLPVALANGGKAYLNQMVRHIELRSIG